MECNNEYGEVNMEYFMRHFLEKTKKEAIAEAKPEIIAEAAIDTARRMLSLNIAMPLIAQVTLLSMDEIMQLSKAQTD